jgi:HKD family nuclease
MISLEKQFTDVQSENTLLMSYCAQLSYFECKLLQSLQTKGSGRVTILVDHRDYENSFSEALAVHGPGIRYSYNKVLLPNPASAFHPKLYLLTDYHQATLFVASANLTIPGFRTNAEIVDKLTLKPDGKGDIRAFMGYLDLLDTLPVLDPNLPEEASTDLKVISQRIRDLLGTRVQANSGCWFLHTARRSLLEQIGQIVNPAEISNITVFSPFFDPGCLAIHSLAKYYPKARLRIIKDNLEEGELNGVALKALRSRLEIERLHHLDNKERRLHAKILIFRGLGRSWLIAGSANLTSPAWLRSAIAEGGNGGNLEAVTLRQLDDVGSITRILGPVRTAKINYVSLHYKSRPDTEVAPNFGFGLIDAEICNASVIARGTCGAWNSLVSKILCEVEEGGELFQFTPSLKVGDDGLAVFTAHMGHHRLVRSEKPAVVSINIIMRSGQIAQGRSWVSRRTLLRMTSEERRARNALREMGNRFFVDGDLYRIVSETIDQFVGEIGNRLIEREAENITLEALQAIHDLDNGRGPKEEDTDRIVSVDDYIVLDSEMRHPLGSGQAHAVSPLRELARAVQLLFSLPEEESDEREEPEGYSVYRSSSRSKRSKQPETPRDEVPPLAETLIGQLASSVRSLNERIIETTVCAQNVGYVLRLLEAVMGILLLRLYIQARVRDNPAAAHLVRAFRETLIAAFSLDGWTEGFPRGWLTRAWADDATRTVLDQAFRDGERASRLMALVAAGVCISLRVNEPEVNLSIQYVLAGLGLILPDEPCAKRDRANQEFRQQIRRLAAQSFGVLVEGDLINTLSSPALRNLPDIAIALRWRSLAVLLKADMDGLNPVEPFEAAIAAVDPETWEVYSAVRSRRKPAAAFIRMVGHEPACSCCNFILPMELVARVRTMQTGCVPCPGFMCGRILVPVALDSQTFSNILAHFVPETTQVAL